MVQHDLFASVCTNAYVCIDSDILEKVLHYSKQREYMNFKREIEMERDFMIYVKEFRIWRDSLDSSKELRIKFHRLAIWSVKNGYQQQWYQSGSGIDTKEFQKILSDKSDLL